MNYLSLTTIRFSVKIHNGTEVLPGDVSNKRLPRVV